MASFQQYCLCFGLWEGQPQTTTSTAKHSWDQAQVEEEPGSVSPSVHFFFLGLEQTHVPPCMYCSVAEWVQFHWKIKAENTPSLSAMVPGLLGPVAHLCGQK